MFEELSRADGMNESEDGIPADLVADLKNAKLQAISLPVPLELDEYINRGLTKGVKVQKSRRLRIWSTLAACFLLAVLMTSARVSPAIAEVLQQIPGLGYIVELVNYDKGLQSAVKNDFVLPLGVSDEHEGIIFTVDGMIMDEGSMIIFYTLDYSGKGHPVQLSEVKLFDDQGEPVQPVTLGYGSTAAAGEDKVRQVHSEITANFNESTKIPPGLSLKVKLSAAGQDRPPEFIDQLPSTWELALPVNKDLFTGMKRVCEINQSVVIEGQRITFEKLTVYPTRMALRVAYDPDNSKKIFAFDDLTLVNEQGEEWGRIANGMTGSKEDEYHETLFFQSNYFTQPQKLYLRGKSIRALDKDKTRFVFDLDQKKIIESPPGLKLYQVNNNASEKVIDIAFLLKLNPDLDKLRGYGVLSFEFTDKAGKSFSLKRQGCSTCSEAPAWNETISISLPLDQDYQSPLTFQIQDYPSRITGEFDIRIK